MTAGVLTIPESEYHADKIGDAPSLSASIAKVICNASALHAWNEHPRLNPDYKPKVSDKFDIGTAAHALLLEGKSAVEVIEAPDWRSKGAQEARDLARSEGRLPLLHKNWDEVQAMVEAARRQIDTLDVDPKPFTDGKPEQTLVWEEDGVICRARLDWLRDDRATIDDLKTTRGSANPESWTRTLYSIGADIQAAFYLRGLFAVDASDGPEVEWGTVPVFRFVVQETFAPYALSVVELGSAALAIADRKVEYAIQTWKRCLAEDRWPGYADQVCVAELPPWEEARWLDKETIEEFDYGEGVPF